MNGHGEDKGGAGAAVLPSAGNTEQGETAVAGRPEKKGEMMADTSVAAARLGALLVRIREALQVFLDRSQLGSHQAESALPYISVLPHDIETAVLYLRDLGLTHDAMRLRAEWGQCVISDCMGEWLATLCDGESEEYRDRLTELFGPFPSHISPDDPTVADRQLILEGRVVALRELVDDLIHTLGAGAHDRVTVIAGPTPTASPKTTPIVFVSSTIEDLEEHRGKARDAVNQVGFVPRMKEYFAARGDSPPLAVCLEKVSGSAAEPPADVVVLIVAHRYGWVPEDQPGSDRKSITWLECEKAREDGKEVLAFVVDKECDWPGELREEHRIAEETARRTGTPELLREVQSNVDWLGRFKAWIDSLGIRATFTTPESLHSAVLAALYEWQKRQAR